MNLNAETAVYNLVLHECIAFGDQRGAIQALDLGADPMALVRLGDEHEGINAMERSERTGDVELIKLIRCQNDAE